MLPFPKISKRRAIIGSGIILAVCLLGYYFAVYSRGENKYPILPQETQVAKQDSKIKITPNTDIVQKIVYTKCSDEEVIRTKPAENLVGLNYYQVQNIYSGWTIDKFDNLEVVMVLQVDSYCREHANNMFLGIKDGYVAVYYGKPGSKAIFKEITKIPVSNIMPQDVEELQRGLVVQSKEELLQTLEGMQAK